MIILTMYLTDLDYFLTDLANIYIDKSEYSIVPKVLSAYDRELIIGDWLAGENRQDIAMKRNVGNGTVYNIVQEWTNQYGSEKANVLRELAVKLRENGLDVKECVEGLRISNILKKYGIKEAEGGRLENKITYFLNEIYKKCVELDLTPQTIFDYIGEIQKFSEEIPLSEINQYLKTRIEEKETLEIGIKELNESITKLQKRKYEEEQEIERLTGISKRLSRNLQLFRIARYQLAEYGITIDNISHFVNCVIGISKKNYDAVKVLEIMADYQNLEPTLKYYKTEINDKKTELESLRQEKDNQNIIFNSCRMKLHILEELEIAGIGNKDLRTLIDALHEISREHNKSSDQIKKEFFEDLRNYEQVIGSRKELEKLKIQIRNLQTEAMKENFYCSSKMLQRSGALPYTGYEDNNIMIEEFLSSSDISRYKKKYGTFYRKAIIKDLIKYKKIYAKNLKKTIRKSKRNIYRKETRKQKEPTIKNQEIVDNNEKD